MYEHTYRHKFQDPSGKYWTNELNARLGLKRPQTSVKEFVNMKRLKRNSEKKKERKKGRKKERKKGRKKGRKEERKKGRKKERKKRAYL